MSPGPNTMHFYPTTQQLQISACIEQVDLIDAAVNENDLANTFFNYTPITISSWISICPNESIGKQT